MDEFEKLLETERISVERFVRFRLNAKADADDVLQEIYLTAYQKFSQLKNKDSFKAWMISIATDPASMSNAASMFSLKPPFLNDAKKPGPTCTPRA